MNRFFWVKGMIERARLFVWGMVILSAAWSAEAAVCTSLSAGDWNVIARWSCGHIPVAADTVVIAHNAIRMRGNYTVAGVTINAGAVLNDDGNNLTVNGNVVVNGQLGINQGGALRMRTAGATLSGTGIVKDLTIEIDAANISVPAGSTLDFDPNAEIDVGANLAGSLTINGTVTAATQTAGDRVIRVSTGGSLTVGPTGVVNAPNSRLDVRNGASATNDGTITVGDLRGRTGTPVPVFTQGVNSTLNVSAALCAAANPCTLNASAAGNTVNYTGAAQTVKVPSGAPATYYNLLLSGSGTKTMPAAAMTVAGNFSMSGTATATAAAALTVGGSFDIGATNTFANGANALNVAGDFAQNGTFTAGSGTVTLDGGAAVQTISGTGPLGFANLTVSNTGGITLARNVTVTSAIIGAVTLSNTCPTDYTLTSNGGATVAHSCPPAAVVNSINRADPSPTSAPAVSWTVTFSISVTGVDASAFALAASGVSGAHITSVTGSGTTWTVTANTGIGAGTLGLDQTGPGSVVPALTGTFTGQVYTISSTPALAEYRMDEASWNGTANEAIDSGTGGFPGTAAGLTTRPTTSIASPAIAGSPGTCRYGVFNRSNKDYIALPAGFPNFAAAAGDFTIAAWINVASNTLPGQRIFIDDENNTSPGGWGFSVGETTAFGAGGLRFYYRQASTYILDTVPIPSNQWLFVALSVHLAVGANASTATIYAYNTGGTLVTSNTGTFTWTAGSDPGPSSIGGETNASGEGTNAFGFGGSIDELRVYQKELSQAAVAALAAQTHACPVNAPDHLVIQSSGSGLTCAASTLTVVACQDASCATPYTLGVSGTLSATGAPTVNWDGTTGGAAGAGFVIPNGSSSVTKDVQVATAGSVVFGVSSATPTPANSTTCSFGAPACTFTANTAGFIFSDTTSPGNVYTIPAQVSGIASPTLYLRAVQASTTNPAVCTPAIIGQTTAVNMGYVCNNPATCQAGNLATINSTAIASGSPGSTSVSLTFDANGSAPITARYDDVGRITLNANKTVTPFSGATAVTLNGSSNAYVIAPHHFGFSGITSGIIKAGAPFSATVTAYNGLGAPTATGNFGKETPAEGVALSFTKYQPTGAGAVNGSFSGSVGAFNGGAATGTNLAWDEVGTIDLTATLASGSYLGSGLSATGNTGATGAVGRFIPDHFDTVVTEGCVAGAFSYSGQPFTVRVTAMNGAGTPAKTVNYDGSANTSPNFAQTVTLSDAIAAGVGSLAPTAIAASLFAAGVASPTPAYTFTSVTTVPTTIALRAVDTDSVTSSGHAEGTAAIRSGRLRLQNANGSELLNLPVDAKLQYWAGASTGWQTNTADTCAPLAAANFAFAFPVDAKNLLAACETAVTVGGSAPNFTVSLAKPGAGNAGWTDLTLNLGATASGNQCTAVGGPGGAATTANAPWLQYNWTGAVGNPTARATFGVYKSGPVIHRREMY